MATYVALLRGINLGAVSKIPMKQLRSLFEEIGHQNTRTYLQSGNVIFESRSWTPRKLAAAIEDEVARATGFTGISVMVRTHRELARVAAGNPFPTKGIKRTLLHVMFLADSPSPAAIRSLDPDRSPPNEFAVKGSHIYLWLPNGWARSKLTVDYFEKKLTTRATARNWNTVTKVLELMAGDG